MGIQHTWSLLTMTRALTAYILIAKRRYLDKAKEASTEQDKLVKTSCLASASFVKKLTEWVIRFLIVAAVILVDISLILLFFSMMKEWI